MIAIITSNFTSHGKERDGFYDNVDKINGWNSKYKFPIGVLDLFNELNHSPSTTTYCPERAYFVAYVLISEGYKVHVETD